MFGKDVRWRSTFEIMLVLISLGLTCLLYKMNGHKLAILNLYYLPVILAAFFLGRYRAGVLALFCVIAAFVITVFDMQGFTLQNSPLAIALLVTVWGAVLGLTTLLVGTLSDERAQKVEELHDAYVGVVEVMSSYLNSKDQTQKDRPSRVSKLSRQVAQQLRLTEQEIDDVAVAALLHEMGNVEVTARVIHKAIGHIGSHESGGAEHTFHGRDLIQAMGSSISGALPLLVGNEDHMHDEEIESDVTRPATEPFGAKIIRTVHAYDTLVHKVSGASTVSPEEAITTLRAGDEEDYHPVVVDGLARIVVEDKPKAARRSSGQSAAVVSVKA